jgi:hypothetical protein
MVREQINAMALEAGMYQTEDAVGETLWLCDQEELERFAALVASAERELHIAAAIRSRSHP